MSRGLNEKQIAAIEYLALPARGGLTYEQIATEVGVHRDTLLAWRKDSMFQDAYKRRVVEVTQERLPDMMDAAIKGVTEDRNAAIFRTLLQAHGLLTEKHEIDTGGKGTDVEAMRAKIASMRNKDDAES